MTLDAPISEENVKEVVLKIFKNASNPIIQFEPGSNLGDGMLGVTAAVTVKLDEEVKNIFIKMATQDDQLREATFQDEIFENEGIFYSKIFPIFDQLCLEYFKKEFDVVPRPLFSLIEYKKECIVLEDLSKKGFSLIKGTNYFNQEQLLMVLKAYSYLHGCGFILKKKHNDFFQELIKKCKTNFLVSFGNKYGFIKLSNQCLNVVKKNCDLNEDGDILEKIEEIRLNITSSLKYFNKIVEYSTILHMDCWRNNIMFKYNKDNTNFEEVKLIDFQMWTINSPTFDVLHTLYSNAPSKEILDNLDYYLDYYYTSLSGIIVEMNGNPQELFPRETFLQQWKNFSSFGFLMGLMITRELLGGPEALPNIVEYIKDNKPLDELFIYDIKDELEYCGRIKVMIRHFIKNHYI